MPTPPVCPICKSSDPVLKVSQIYISGITEPGNRSDQDRSRLAAVFGGAVSSPAEIRQAVHIFGPPSGRSQITRPIHPDMYVFVFAAVVVFILFNTFFSQRAYFWPILGISVVSGVIYYFTRAALIAAFRNRQEVNEAEKNAVDRAVGDWMKLYYCTEDACVFDPSRSDTAPVAELQRYLAHKTAGPG